MTAKDIEIRVARYFDYRRNIIVPNASWGVGLHECDLLILSARNYATEVEIKISRSDLRADQHKKHGHNSVKIKNLWFAVPAELVPSAVELCPDRAGILGVREKEIGNTLWSSWRIEHISPYDLGWEGWSWDVPRSSISSEVFVVRKPQPEPGARAWTSEERLKLAEIGVLRYWGRRDK